MDVDALLRELAELKAEVTLLKDIEAVKRCKHQYWRCFDTANIDGMREVLHPDVVLSVEASATGAMLSERMPVPPIDDRDGPASMVSDDGLARAMFVRPAAPSASDWRSVREAILRDGNVVASEATSYRRRIGVGFLGVAAAAMVCGLLLSDGTSSDPTIVITDVLSAPDVEFVVLRRGILR